MEGTGCGESGADARVLGRLLSDMVVLDAIPSEEGLRQFLEAAVQDIPGVQSCRLRLEGARTPGEEGYPSPSLGHWILALAADGETYGTIDLQIDDEQGIAPYRPFLTNLAVSLALLLARRRQRDEIMARLQASETMYRSLVDAMGEGVCFQDANGRISAINHAAERILGRSVEQLIGRTSDEFQWGSICEDGSPFPGDEHPSVVTLRTGEPQHDVVMGIHRPDGTLAWISINSRPLVLPGETRPHAVVTTFRDIGEHKQAERALMTSQAQLEAAMDLANLVNWELDVGTGIFTFNDRFYALYGTTATCEGGYQMPAEVYAKTFVHPDDRHMVAEEIAKALETTDPNYRAYLEHRMICRDGEIRHVAVRYTITKDELGRTIKTHGANQDITERKQAEQERLDLEGRLQQSQRLESLGVLAGGIAHDFNNILMSVLGNAELALTGLSASAPARENLLEITASSRRAADLCRQMLAYSGRGHFVTEAIDLRALIEGMMGLLQSTISKKALLNLNMGKNLPLMRGDVSQLGQVIMNLVINASEAIGERSGVITISTGVTECTGEYLESTYGDENLAPGLYLTLEVSDTGAGMDAETRKHLFEPFFTTKFTGRGLGLSAVLGIVRGHKGALRLYSELGKGTTFKILFPVSETAAESLARSSGATKDDWRGEGTILLVDDEEPIRTLGARMLAALGFTVLAAADGREALAVYAEHREEITLVLLDLTMPRMDGEQTLRELRLIDPGVRVVMSSGYAESDITARFAGKGLAGFVHKPYSLAELAAQLRAALEGAERGSGTA